LLLVGALLAPLYALSDCSSSSRHSNHSDDCSNHNSDNCSSESKNNCSSRCYNNCGATWPTTFVARTLTDDANIELGLNNYYRYNMEVDKDQDTFFSVFATYLHKRSTKHNKITKYFFGGNTVLTMDENNTAGAMIDPLWVNLIGPNNVNYTSNLTFCPERVVNGGYITFAFDFNRWLCNTWMLIEFTPARITQTMRLNEVDANTTGTINGFANAAEAFDNPDWQAGRIAQHKKHATGVDDVQIKLGYDYYFPSHNDDHLGGYLVVTAPTRKHSDIKYLFEPVIGTRHASFGFGLNTDVTLWGNEAETQEVHFMSDFKYRYVFSACEKRLFDLCNNGPLSRYLQVVNEDQPSNSLPAVNYLALKADVHPGSTINWWSALHYNYCQYNFEIGYNLWWREKEKVCLKETVQPVGIYDMVGDCKGNPTSASQATIKDGMISGANQTPSDPAFIPLTNASLNLASGAAPSALTNTIYAGLSYNSTVYCFPGLIGFAGSYEFARCNSAINQWAVWVDAALTF
jgi:hypothetical protein